MEWDIAYNTSRDELLYSEYGRTVQDLLRNADQVADEDRQAYVERVIKLMLQMQPGIKQQENYQERLWKHAFHIAGGHLDVVVPEGISAEPDEELPTADQMPYPELSSRKPHYGRNILALIDAGKKMEDGPERDFLTYTVAYYMKVALSDWRDGKFMNEEMIRKDIYELSEKTLVLPPDAKIGSPNQNQPSQDDGVGRRRKKKKGNSGGGGNNNNNRSSRSKNRSRNNRRR